MKAKVIEMLLEEIAPTYLGSLSDNKLCSRVDIQSVGVKYV